MFIVALGNKLGTFFSQIFCDKRKNLFVEKEVVLINHKNKDLMGKLNGYKNLLKQL